MILCLLVGLGFCTLVLLVVFVLRLLGIEIMKGD
jgi:hypothetical protein